MTIHSLYRAIIDWAARPVAVAMTTRTRCGASARHDLADLPIGPEPEDEGAAFEAGRRDRCA